jgi:hypothetical protein
MRVLVVEDHTELADSITRVLRREGLAVDTAYDGGTALDFVLDADYDVVVLDRDLPDVHGDEVCGELAASGVRTKILMLTASPPPPTWSKGSAWAPTTTWPSPSRGPSSSPVPGPSAAAPTPYGSRCWPAGRCGSIRRGAPPATTAPRCR